MKILKNYFKRKSKVALAIDAVIGVAIILLLIPATRKDMAALILKPTLFIHQPKVNAQKATLKAETYTWQIENADGITLEFDDFKDKVVLLNFWATWCPPCIAEMPDLQKLYNDYADEVAFIFVSNESSKTVKEFLHKKGYNLPVYRPVSQYPNDFETSSIPTTFIINKSGEIVIHKAGVAKWNSKRVRSVLDVLISAD